MMESSIGTQMVNNQRSRVGRSGKINGQSKDEDNVQELSVSIATKGLRKGERGQHIEGSVVGNVGIKVANRRNSLQVVLKRRIVGICNCFLRNIVAKLASGVLVVIGIVEMSLSKNLEFIRLATLTYPGSSPLRLLSE